MKFLGFRFIKTPIMLETPNKAGVSREFSAWQVFFRNTKLIRRKTYTGRKFQRIGQLSIDGSSAKPGNKIVYSAEDFTPYEYELIR